MNSTKMNPALITTHQAAEILGVTHGRVVQLCVNGQLEAMKIGRDWLIHPSTVHARAADPPPAGRRWPVK